MKARQICRLADLIRGHGSKQFVSYARLKGVWHHCFRNFNGLVAPILCACDPITVRVALVSHFLRTGRFLEQGLDPGLVGGG